MQNEYEIPLWIKAPEMEKNATSSTENRVLSLL